MDSTLENIVFEFGKLDLNLQRLNTIAHNILSIKARNNFAKECVIQRKIYFVGISQKNIDEYFIEEYLKPNSEKNNLLINRDLMKINQYSTKIDISKSLMNNIIEVYKGSKKESKTPNLFSDTPSYTIRFEDEEERIINNINEYFETQNILPYTLKYGLSLYTLNEYYNSSHSERLITTWLWLNFKLADKYPVAHMLNCEKFVYLNKLSEKKYSQKDIISHWYTCISQSIEELNNQLLFEYNKLYENEVQSNLQKLCCDFCFENGFKTPVKINHLDNLSRAITQYVYTKGYLYWEELLSQFKQVNTNEIYQSLKLLNQKNIVLFENQEKPFWRVNFKTNKEYLSDKLQNFMKVIEKPQEATIDEIKIALNRSA